MPAGRTYTPIQRTVLSSESSAIDFNSIPQNYTDLILIVSNKGTDANTGWNNWFIRYNNDSSAIYSNTRLQGDGSTASSNRVTNGTRHDFWAPRGGEPGWSTNIFHINQYANTSTFKTMIWRDSFVATGGYVVAWAGLYRSTNSITSINLSGTMAPGATATLYGILAA